MNNSHRELISIILTILIISVTFFVIHRFIAPLAWAIIISIATAPLYARWKKLFGRYHNLSALTFTLIMAVIIAIPIFWLSTLLFKEIQFVIRFLTTANMHGEAAPSWLQTIPMVGHKLLNYWQQTLGQPQGISQLLGKVDIYLAPTSHFLQKIGLSLAKRGIVLAFTVLCLFFFYRDQDSIVQHVMRVGQACLGEHRWRLYSQQLPKALRATVNGTILVSLGVGFCMSIAYALAQVPAPIVLGVLTAIFTIIPFASPLIFTIVAGVLALNDHVLAGSLIFLWGIIVLIASDNIIKPIIIGSAVRLPFVAVLFGILGGIETLGLIGIFLGPIIMVLFITLWLEPKAISYRNE